MDGWIDGRMDRWGEVAISGPHHCPRPCLGSDADSGRIFTNNVVIFPRTNHNIAREFCSSVEGTRANTCTVLKSTGHHASDSWLALRRSTLYVDLS